MYTPPAFRIEDHEELMAFIGRHSFAIIITHDGDSPHATHMPVLLDMSNGPHGTLLTHMARANPQWKHFANQQEVLVIFTGPHAYISPAWYAESPAVPTWNYTAVHVYGIPRVIENPERFAQLLTDLVEFNEDGRENRWSGEMPEGYRDRVMQGAIGIEIEITRVEGKFKLSQNRSSADVEGVIAALSTSPDQTDRDTAEMMRAATPASS